MIVKVYLFKKTIDLEGGKVKNRIKKLLKMLIEFQNDKYGSVIFISWIVLIGCLIVKLFGGNWFELSTDNEKFIAFCGYVDQTIWLKKALACLIYLISGYFIICIVLNEKKLKIKHILIFFPIMIFKSLISWEYSNLAFVIDIFILFVIPLILKRNWKRPLITILLVLFLQVITLLIRNLDFGFGFNVGNTIVENYLYQIDYYIMILLCYFYNFKYKKREEDE